MLCFRLELPLDVGNRRQKNEGPAWGCGTLACAQPFEDGAGPDLRIGGYPLVGPNGAIARLIAPSHVAPVALTECDRESILSMSPYEKPR